MATEDRTPAPPGTPAATAPRPRRRHWLAIIILAPVAIIGFLIALGMFAPKSKPTDATSVLRAAANDPAIARAAGIEGNLTETSPLPGPMGLQAEFLWTSRPGAIDAEIYTFDVSVSAAGAFEHLNEVGSLLIPAGDGDTHTSTFLTDAGSPAEKRFSCAQTSKGFACGSISGGLPVIVILRRPLETEVQKYDPSDPMSAFREMDQSKARTDAMSRGMDEVDTALQRLGITTQPSQN